MPEAKKSSPTAASSPPSPVLTPAAESSDPVVHKLLGDRQSHALYVTPDPQEEVARERERAAIVEIDVELARLGYRAT